MSNMDITPKSEELILKEINQILFKKIKPIFNCLENDWLTWKYQKISSTHYETCRKLILTARHNFFKDFQKTFKKITWRVILLLPDRLT